MTDIAKQFLDKMKVATPEEAEDCDIMVCAPMTEPMHFPDNIAVACAQCGAPMQLRPNPPVKPKKICIKCAMPQIMAEIAKGDTPSFNVTQKTKDEYELYCSKPKGNA